MICLVVLGCVLRPTTKKVNFLGRKVHPRENPGYAYVLLSTETLLRRVTKPSSRAMRVKYWGGCWPGGAVT